MIRISGLYVHPIKSCRGTALDEAEIGATGFVDDRRWLVVDRHGTFMTQRDWPALARVAVAVTNGGLKIDAEGMSAIDIAEPDPDARSESVTIWNDRCDAVSAGAVAAEWFSEFLGTPCRLVRMPAFTVRQVDTVYADPGDRVGFADGFPFLLISQASLDELNRRLENPLPMDRFRPNIVVEGCEPHDEDGWTHLKAGGVEFRVVKPCARCVVTTTDQLTGERGREPLRTLATYRRFGGEVLFGQNLIHAGAGILKVGDHCDVTERA
jgi:uncharacterized protein YcbX